MWPGRRWSSLTWSAAGSLQGAPPAVLVLGQAEAEGCPSSLPRHPAPLQHIEDAPHRVGCGSSGSYVLQRRLAGQLSPKKMLELCSGSAFSGLQCQERIPHWGKPPHAAAWPASALPQAAAAAHIRCRTEMRRSISPRTGKDVLKKEKKGDSLPSYFTRSSTANRQKRRFWQRHLLTPRKASPALGSEGPAVAKS